MNQHQTEPSKRKLVIWGASGHALVVADIFRLRGEAEIVGFLDSVNLARKGAAFAGSVILGGEAQLTELLADGVRHIIIGFGDCAARLRAAEYATGLGFSLLQAIHPSAVIASDVQIGPGTVIAAGVVINPAVTIGSNVIINTSASVDHECVIADGAHIGPGVRLAGNVRVGKAAWVGIGSSVIEKITLGDSALVGAGSVVVRDVPPGVMVYGVPARVMRGV